MKIPRTSEHVQIELLPGSRDLRRDPFGSTVALRATAKVNGEVVCVMADMRSEYLDQKGYSDSVFEQLARDIGRKVLFG